MDDDPAALRARLAELDRQIAGVGDHDALVEQAKEAARQADADLQAAKAAHDKEADDVRRLGSVGGRLKAAFGGGSDETRTREHDEEQAARTMLEEAQRRSDAAWAALDAVRDGGPVLPHLREERAAVLDALEQQATASPELREVVTRLQETTAKAETLATTIGTAADAVSALEQADQALEEAHILATTTMAREGQSVSALVKYAEIDAAQDALAQADRAAQAFADALGDDHLVAPSLQVESSETTFDLLGGVFSRINVRDDVVKAQSATRRLLGQVQRAQADLEGDYAAVQAEQRELRARREQLLIG